MIRADTDGVPINGDFGDVCMDFIEIIRTFKQALTEEFDEEKADKIVEQMGKMAYLDPDDPQLQEKLKAIYKESPFRKENTENG